ASLTCSRPPSAATFPYTTLFRSARYAAETLGLEFVDQRTDPGQDKQDGAIAAILAERPDLVILTAAPAETAVIVGGIGAQAQQRSEEHTSELQSRENLVCRLLLD